MIIAILILLGLCFGSFTNALVWRLHEQAKPKTKRAASDKDLSIKTGRSMCPDCKHTLSAADLLPVLSWIALKGKCRYCRKSIHWQYPLVELLTALLFVGSYNLWPYGFEAFGLVRFTSWLVILVGFMALSVYDFRWQLLPNKIIFPLIFISSLVAAIGLLFTPHTLSYVIKIVLSLVIASGLFYVLYQLSSGRWIGGGDVKLGVILGLVLMKPELCLLMLFLASLLGTLYALPAIRRSGVKSKQHIPFGPFLMIATAFVLLLGQSSLDWYNRLLFSV